MLRENLIKLPHLSQIFLTKIIYKQLIISCLISIFANFIYIQYQLQPITTNQDLILISSWSIANFAIKTVQITLIFLIIYNHNKVLRNWVYKMLKTDTTKKGLLEVYNQKNSFIYYITWPVLILLSIGCQYLFSYGWAFMIFDDNNGYLTTLQLFIALSSYYILLWLCLPTIYFLIMYGFLFKYLKSNLQKSIFFH